MTSSTNITNTISSTPMPQIQRFGSHNNKSNLTNKFNTATSLTSRNTLTGQIRIPKLATAPPASARPEAQSMPPLIDYANRRRYKITFPSQYLLYAHASKKNHTHRCVCKSRRKISDRCKGHLLAAPKKLSWLHALSMHRRRTRRRAPRPTL